jgi:CPA2 family monovalent cation:H+ antiporter-2
MHGFDFIQDLAVVMLVAGLAGWVCHRAGLSVVVGYLAAGMVIGPYTPPFSLVSSVARIETLAQVGLVFLMFSIGMKLSLRRLRRLGGSLVVATGIGAILMFNLARLVGAGLGWGAVHTAFLGAMLMVSSSAVISKVLQDTGGTHEKSGQMAMGVSILEDIVAVVMLTLLNSITRIGGAGAAGVGETLGLLGSFIAVAGVGGLLAVPWLLRRMSLTAGQELTTIVTAGLLFMLAILAQKAGFSLALGAFLLGAIVAETPQRTQVDRTFEGMHDLFSAVFFVAIGMMIDFRAALHLWWLVLLLAALALVGRSLAVGTGLLLAGQAVPEAVRVGLTVTPLGEFSFIIAQLGVMSGVLPAEFQAVAVGVSLLTALASPVLVRQAPAWGARAEACLPGWLRRGLEYYQSWIERLRHRQKHNLLWQLCRKRVAHILVEALVVTGLLVFAEALWKAAGRLLPAEKLFPHAPQVVFWSGLTLVVLIPLVAIWRNLSALAMILAEVGTAGSAQAARLRPVVEHGLKLVGAVLLSLWLTAVIPFSGMGRWVPLLAVAIVGGALALLRSKLIYWHSLVETELQDRLGPAEVRATGTNAPWLAQSADWPLALTECIVPDLADCRGRTLGELRLRSRFGCVVTGIERQGVAIASPSRETALYPHDRVLLLGDPGQMAAARVFLGRVRVEAAPAGFDEVRMETVRLPDGSPRAGRTLGELAPSHFCGVQVAGINRGGRRMPNPGEAERLLEGDILLVLGRPDQIAAFRAWLHEQ